MSRIVLSFYDYIIQKWNIFLSLGNPIGTVIKEGRLFSISTILLLIFCVMSPLLYRVPVSQINPGTRYGHGQTKIFGHNEVWVYNLTTYNLPNYYKDGTDRSTVVPDYEQYASLPISLSKYSVNTFTLPLYDDDYGQNIVGMHIIVKYAVFNSTGDLVFFERYLHSTLYNNGSTNGDIDVLWHIENKPMYKFLNFQNEIVEDYYFTFAISFGVFLQNGTIDAFGLIHSQFFEFSKNTGEYEIVESGWGGTYDLSTTPANIRIIWKNQYQNSLVIFTMWLSITLMWTIRKSKKEKNSFDNN